MTLGQVSTGSVTSRDSFIRKKCSTSSIRVSGSDGSPRLSRQCQPDRWQALEAPARKSFAPESSLVLRPHVFERFPCTCRCPVGSVAELWSPGKAPANQVLVPEFQSHIPDPDRFSPYPISSLAPPYRTPTTTDCLRGDPPSVEI